MPVRPEWGLPEAGDERARQPGWHEYRLGFTREMRSKADFEKHLQEMRQELEAALSKG